MTVGVDSDGSRADREWPDSLDVDDLLESGWRPTGFRQVVIKIHSRCNLSCDYCYMYEMADQSWRSQPRVMAPRTVERVAQRIGEHARANGLSQVEVVLHGGEPLLAGVDALRHAVTAIRAAVDPGVEVGFSVQTNGTLLDERFLALFAELGVSVGVSLDGYAEAHDRHRRNAAGHGSYEAVRAGLRQLNRPEFRHLFTGLLCTVDVANDPVRTYESLLRFRPPTVDLLLPHGNWATPPPGWSADGTRTPYADWLIAVFDRWYEMGARETRVRLFNEIIRLLVGGASQTESVGLSPVALLVIETNGGIEQADTLKSAFEGAAGTPLHVYRDGFDAAMLLPSMVARQIGERALSRQCQGCEIRRICGGGQYPHRYRPGTGFANPSVYCADLRRLITHIGNVVRGDMTALREMTRRQRTLRKDER